MRRTVLAVVLTLFWASPIFAEVSDEIIEKNKPAVVAIYSDEDLTDLRASGFFVDNSGNILTNYHVCEKCPRAWARLYDGRRLELTRIFVQAEKDLAIWRPKIWDKDVPYFSYLALENSFWLAPEAPVASIGNSKYGVWQVIKGNFKNKHHFLRHQPTVLYGFSGGPLINKSGHVIGVNVGSDNREVSVIKENFYASAIRLDDMREFLDQFYRIVQTQTPIRIFSSDRLSAYEFTPKIRWPRVECDWIEIKEGRWCRH